MKAHWTTRSVKDYLFRIAADFIAQLEKKMEFLSISQDELAKKLGVTKGRVSQLINNPGNFKLFKMIEYAKALGCKISIVAYEDDDPENKKGPINSEIFRICWENLGKPRDLWDLQDFTLRVEVAGNATNAVFCSNANEYISLALAQNERIEGNCYLPAYSYQPEKGCYIPQEILEKTLHGLAQ